MATSHLPPDSAAVIRPDHFSPAAAGRIAASLLNRHNAHEIAEAVQVLGDVLDLIGGDPDVEANGDELDGTDAEDEEGNRHLSHTDPGAGCPIADPGGCEHDGREPDCDAEEETWSHWMDHSPELHIGHRPGWNDHAQQEKAR